ncbi:MAG: adenylate/guanylate cyclase domain-containing protein [Verrucomicrobia bacterium]|nr:adenylate/guanylate cyclase domain-containing protein [Verrucomicrobiota bacterium]
MSAIRKPRSFSLLRWCLLLPIPVIWGVLEYRKQLAFLENKSIDWRFQQRGELESSVKLIYVDVDSLSISALGNMPWSRDLHSKVAAALVNEAKVKAVGFDFVFSDAGIAQSADETKMTRGNREFDLFLRKQPPVVLAAGYAGWKFINVRGEKEERLLPLLSQDPRWIRGETAKLVPPEIPYFLFSDRAGNRRFDTPAAAIGLIDTLDNGTRLVPAWTPANTGITYYHMAVELARLHWGLPDNALRVTNGVLEFVRADGSVHARLPLIDGQLLEINWFTRWEGTKERPGPKSMPVHVEFFDVLRMAIDLESSDPQKKADAREFFSDPELRDAVVLVGPVDPLLQDLAPTSLDEEAVPKVSVHGNLLRTIVSGQLLRRPPTWAVFAIIGGFAVFVILLSAVGSTRTVWTTIVKELSILIVPVACYAWLAFFVFKHGHWVLPFTAPIGAALTTGIGGMVLHLIDLQQAKGRIKGMFGTYLAPQLVDRMVESGEDPQLGGHEEQITAYFSDIQSFSTFSEILSAKQLVDLLNEYLTACTNIVTAQGGTLDKYIGDAVVAMYGAPIKLQDHAFRACVASQLIHQRLAELRAKWKSEGDRWPELVWKMQTRIGLNTGKAVIGNMGSETRFNYTMMGDDVNLAARMESGAKSWGVYTMCSGETMEQCRKFGGDRVVFRFLNKIRVKGRSQAVPIYEIMGLKESLPPTALECRGLFDQAMAKVGARDWDGAVALFRQSAELEPLQPGKTPGVKLNASLALIEKVEDLRQMNLGDDWDGVYEMTEK